MTMYKVTNNETGETLEWTAQQVLDEVNAERSDSWVDYTLEDLATNHDEVVDWAYQYTIEKRRDSMSNKEFNELIACVITQIKEDMDNCHEAELIELLAAVPISNLQFYLKGESE